MDSPPRRRGRPPGPTQILPLFLHQVRSRVAMRAVVSVPTERELRCYVEWARGLTLMAADEVLVRVVDQALGDYFKRDKLWRPLRSDILAKDASRAWEAAFAAIKARRDPATP